MRLKRAAMVFVTAALSAAVLAGCAGGNREEAAAGGADEESCETGDASMDNPRNQDGIGGNELLAVSFGTSYNDSRRISIGAVEEALEKAIPDYSLRRAFTSQIIIDRVKSRDGVAIDNVGEALERAVKNGPCLACPPEASCAHR